MSFLREVLNNLEARKRVYKFLLSILLVCLIGMPLVLVITYPGQASYIVDFSKSLLPWACFIIIATIYSSGIKALLLKLVELLGRVNKVSAGNASVELNSQEQSSLSIYSEGIKSLATHIQELSAQNQGANNLASHFFIKYIAATIYGTQFKFLEELERSSAFPVVATNFYGQYVAIAPEGTNYAFNRWMGYLTENFLVVFDPNDGFYKITPAAQNFLNTARTANLSASNFIN